MPLSLRVTRDQRQDALSITPRSLEEGDQRLARTAHNATVRIRQLLRGSGERRRKAASLERRRKTTETEYSLDSEGTVADFELTDLQEMLEESSNRGARQWDKFRSLWVPQELENSLKTMLRVAGCPLRVLEAVKNVNNDHLSALIGEGTDPGSGELSLVEEEVALLAGCLFGQTKLVKKLVKRGVSIQAADADGRTALHLASFSGNLEAVKHLMKHGALVNTWDSQQESTPLICAASVNSPDIVTYLLAQGADVNAGLEPDDATALHYAVRANGVICTEKLLRAGAKTTGATPKSETPLHVAADYGFDRCMELLLQYGAAVDLQSGSGCKTPMHLAAEDGSLRCARLLHDYKARLDVQTSRGQTPLHLAAKAQSTEMLELLWDWGADINARDQDQRTALHCCIGKQCRSLDPIRILINHGALVNAEDIAGYTAMHLAAINELSSCVELLMDHGGDATRRNRGGISCLQLIRHRTPSVLSNLPDRFSRAILFYERDGMLNDKFAELKINFKPLMSETKGECHFLKALIDIDQKHLLKHPLCESFLHMKWMKVRKFLFFNVFHYLLFCLLLSIYVLGTCQGDCFNIGMGLKLNKCSGIALQDIPLELEQCSLKDVSINVRCKTDNSGIIETSNDLCGCKNSQITMYALLHPTAYTGIWYVLLFFIATLVCKEIFQLVQDPPQYFRNPENLAEWALTFFLLLIGSPIFDYIKIWQKHLGALAALICWFELMMLVGRLPRLGLYIHMFSKVLKDFFLFLLAYSSLAAGCSVAFVILLPGYAPVSDIFRSVLKVVVMMTGELEFDDTFYGGEHEKRILNPTALLVFAVFVFLITIILMNLLVGLAVSDIQGLQKTAKLGRLVRLTEQMSHIEGTLFSRVVNDHLPDKVCSWIASMALVSPSSYRYTLVLRPNDPNDQRLTRDIMNSACQVAKSRVKETIRKSKLSRVVSDMAYDYDMVKSMQGGYISRDGAAASSMSANESVILEGPKISTVESRMEMTQSALKLLLGEVRDIARALNKLGEMQGMPPIRVPAVPASIAAAAALTEESDEGGFNAASGAGMNGPAHPTVTPSTSEDSDISPY